MNLLIEYVKFNIFRDEHRVPWVHSQMSAVIDNECRQASCKIQRTSKARDSYKQCSIPNKSQAMNSVLKGFICILQLCQLKADFDPAINVIFLLWFIDTPNNPTNDDTTARDLAWVAQHPLHVWRHRCEMDSTSWVHSQSAVHPQIGFILDSSATSLHRKREMYLPAQQWHGMEWHEVQQVFFESVFLVRVREQERRAKGEWTTDQLWSGIHFEEVGRKAFCDPMCLMVWAEMCENSSCDPSASEMCKFPFEEALDQKSMRFTQKKAYSVEPNPIWWHSKPLQKLFKNVISLKCAHSASF